MQLYLAASFSRKDEIRKVAEELNALGFKVQARWLFEQDAVGPAFKEPTAKYQFLRSRAEIDVQDVLACNLLVRFTDDLKSGPTVPSHLATGSRFFEMGLAWGKGTPIVVVGGEQCVFDYMHSITHLENVDQLKTFLKEYARMTVPDATGYSE